MLFLFMLKNNGSKMLFDPECIPCIINQSYNAAKRFTNGNKELQFKIVKEACSTVLSAKDDSSSPKFSAAIQNLIEENLQIKNPYQKIKEDNLNKAKKFIKYLEIMVENSDDKLDTAVRAAILGNIIDLGANPNFNIEEEVNKITSNNINEETFLQLKENLEDAETVLYIADNFEEALFDIILIKQLLPRKVMFAVRSRPILNDITFTDAKYLGIDKICEVMESGSKIAGTDLTQCSSEFLNLFDKADLVIAKGQGNFETLLKAERPIYFMFKVKCDVISRRCGLPVGTSALFLNKKERIVSNVNFN